MKSSKITALVFLATFGLHVQAAGYEEVQITNVRNTTQLVCPSSSSQGNRNTQGGGAAVPGSAQGSANNLSQRGSTNAGSQFRTPGGVPGPSSGSSGSSTGSQAQGQSGTVPSGCWNSLAYLVTFNRRGGGGGEVVVKSFPVAKTMQLKFCPGQQGQPERPC